MKSSLEIAVYHGSNEEREFTFWRNYSVMMSYGELGDCANCYCLEDLEWTLRKFEQECLNRGIKEIEIFNRTSLNVLGFLCGEILEGKKLEDEKITNEGD